MSATGNIYDLGYQGYDGPRQGRVAVTTGLLRGTLAAAVAAILALLYARLRSDPGIARRNCHGSASALLEASRR